MQATARFVHRILKCIRAGASSENLERPTAFTGYQAAVIVVCSAALTPTISALPIATALAALRTLVRVFNGPGSLRNRLATTGMPSMRIIGDSPSSNNAQNRTQRAQLFREMPG